MGRKAKAVDFDIYHGPRIICAFKPARITSYDLVRHFKRNLPSGFGKIGHFGTLDPFASGLLMLGVNGAAKLNDFIHSDLSKTYLAVGKLGVSTDTGDLTVEPSQIDKSSYLISSISKFDKAFIESKLREKFLGNYWQAPHKYSAAKFEGKALHQWAREGVDISKEKVLRRVLSINVVKYDFPYLSIRFEVSSGTYVRTLFSDCANYLGTLGTLVSLVRESVGEMNTQNSLHRKNWPVDKVFDLEHHSVTPDKVLNYGRIVLSDRLLRLFINGVQLRHNQVEENIHDSKKYWIQDQTANIFGIVEARGDYLIPVVNFCSSWPQPSTT